jgi:hypothetical protein
MALEAVEADPEEAAIPTPDRVLLSACRTIAHKKVRGSARAE